jgi:hypothetical protein
VIVPLAEGDGDIDVIELTVRLLRPHISTETL